MKKWLFILFFSIMLLSCNQNIDVFNIEIQNNSSSTVSGIISVEGGDVTSFSVSPSSSKTIGVSGVYTVSYQNDYGRITGTIDYLSGNITFADNSGMTLNITNYIAKDVYIFTGGYIETELPSAFSTTGEYKTDGTEGLKINASATDSSKRVFTPNPSSIAKTIDGELVDVTWTITDSTPPTMIASIHY
jgi:hypothetical protein